MNYCFETAEHLYFFVTLFPRLKQQCTTYSELVSKFSSLIPLKSEERLQWIADQQKDATHHFDNIRLLKTLEYLRESLILTEEHLNHCFSELTETPKNLVLKEMCKRYLGSPMAIDKTAQIWNAVEALKNKAPHEPIDSQWTFIPATPGNFLFNEFAKSITYGKGVEEVAIKEFWNLFPSTPHLKQGLYLAKDTDALKKLVREVTSSPAMIAISAEPEKVVLLKCLLASEGISYHDLNEQETEENNCFFSKLRLSKERSLQERLKLWNLFKDVSIRLPITFSPNQIADELLKRELISSEDHTFLVSLDSLPVPKDESTSAPNPQVLLTPFIPVTKEGVQSFAFFDKSAFLMPKTGILFSPDEIERLFAAGFQLPRSSDFKDRQYTILEAFLEKSIAVYSSCDESYFEDIEPLPIATFHESAEQATSHEDFTLPLNVTYFSATALETYVTCPARYLFSNRLKLRKVDQIEDQYALLFGQSVHLTLERALQKKTAIDLTTEFLLEEFDLALTEVARSLNSKHALYRILRENFKKMAPLIPQMERELQSLFGKSTPKYFEKPFEVELEGIRVRGKIDRIDALADGSLVVLDYKTGNVDFSPEHIKKGTNFQALLYLAACEQLFKEPLAGILFYDLKKKELRRGVFKEEHISPEAKKALTRGHTLKQEKYSELKDLGLSHLNAIAKRIQKGDFNPTPSPENCLYCDQGPFCRRQYGIQ